MTNRARNIQTRWIYEILNAKNCQLKRQWSKVETKKSTQLLHDKFTTVADGQLQ